MGAKQRGIGPGDKFTFYASATTKRCLVYATLVNGCNAMELTCGRFFFPNKEGRPKCNRGDKMMVKIDERKPSRYCGTSSPIWNKPNYFYPAISQKKMKVTFVLLPWEVYPDRGATCTIRCLD